MDQLRSVYYGSTKVHKPLKNGLPPFRPIFSVFGSYYLAKHSVSIVSDITQHKFTVKNFFTFLDKILMQCNHLKMANLDVDCLSTNIP